MTVPPAATSALARTRAAHPWIEPLWNAYAFLDASLGRELRRDGRSLACGPGCHACCTPFVPLSFAEAMGIRLYLQATPQPAGQNQEPDPVGACPFLARGACRVYPARPFACRRFLVFSTRCAPGEDPTATRPRDVHAPSQEALLRALRMTLPVYKALGRTVPEDADRDFFTRNSLLIRDMTL